MRNRSFIYVAAVVVVGAALVLGLWRPWQTRLGPVETDDPDPPVDIAALTIVKQSGGACGVTILGSAGNMSNSSSAGLAAGKARSGPIRFPAPYTIEAVTVTRNESSRRVQVKLTLGGGQRYELLINTDDTVAVAPVPARR